MFPFVLHYYADWLVKKTGTNFQCFQKCSYPLGKGFALLCGSRKYPYSLTEGIGNSGEEGGSQRPKNLKQCMKINWNFQSGGGGGIIGQIPSVGGV